MLSGVCGGLARYFDIHPAFYRVGFVVLTLIGGAGILIYAAAALVIPDEGKEDSIASSVLRDRRERPWPLIGLALVAVAGAVLLSRATLWPRGDLAWVLFLLAGALLLWLTRREPRERVEVTPPPPPAAAPVDETGTTVVAPVAAAPPAPPRPRRHLVRNFTIAFAVLLALLLIAAAVFAAVFRVHLGDGVGDRTYHVVSVDDLQREYQLGIGELQLDLTDLQLPPGETRVDARVDVGRLHVLVPPDVGLRITSDVDWGDLDLLGDSADGYDVDRQLDVDGARVLVLDAHVGAGALDVDRVVR